MAKKKKATKAKKGAAKAKAKKPAKKLAAKAKAKAKKPAKKAAKKSPAKRAPVVAPPPMEQEPIEASSMPAADTDLAPPPADTAATDQGWDSSEAAS